MANTHTRAHIQRFVSFEVLTVRQQFTYQIRNVQFESEIRADV